MSTRRAVKPYCREIRSRARRQAVPGGPATQGRSARSLTVRGCGVHSTGVTTRYSSQATGADARSLACWSGSGSGSGCGSGAGSAASRTSDRVEEVVAAIGWGEAGLLLTA
ncbi:hypothetical protein [Streptomyces europaeiscabiei]|uniref:hypothetical protein n=1 Tax=Streptomyces europaeiscabiei TaxID=146819 RepID=UPI0038F60BDF